jgi:hypothetical protein
MQTRLSSGVTALPTCMLEHGANPVAIPPPPRLAAHFASTNCFAVERFRCASVWCRVGYVDMKSGEFLLGPARLRTGRPVAFSASATSGSNSSHNRQTILNQPWPWAKPTAIRVLPGSPLTLNHDGQRCTNFCSSSFFMFVHRNWLEFVRLLCVTKKILGLQENKTELVSVQRLLGDSFGTGDERDELRLPHHAVKFHRAGVGFRQTACDQIGIPRVLGGASGFRRLSRH